MERQLPDRLYFKIGEVAEFTGVKPHVLRYWEAEIPAIRPGKNRHQQRLYCKSDIELILRLKELLYGQGYTIAGARQALRRKPQNGESAAPDTPCPTPLPPAAGGTAEATPAGDTRLFLAELRRDLLALRASLDAPL